MQGAYSLRRADGERTKRWRSSTVRRRPALACLAFGVLLASTSTVGFVGQRTQVPARRLARGRHVGAAPGGAAPGAEDPSSEEVAVPSLRKARIESIKEDLLELLSKANPAEVVGLDLGVPLKYNLTFGPLGLHIEDLQQLPADRFRDFQAREGGAPVDVQHHQRNMQLLKDGHLVACKVNGKGNKATEAARLKYGDSVLLSTEDFLNIFNKTSGEQAETHVFCDVYDCDGRHTDIDQEVIRRTAPGLHLPLAGRSSTLRSEALSNLTLPQLPDNCLAELLQLVHALSKEAAAEAAFERSRFYDFLSNKLWTRGRTMFSWLEHNVARPLEARLRSPVTGLLYLAPGSDAMFIGLQWHALPQLRKLQIQSLAQSLRNAGQGAPGAQVVQDVETKIRALRQETDRGFAALRQLYPLGAAVFGDWRVHIAMLAAVLAWRLYTVQRNLVLPGVVEAVRSGVIVEVAHTLQAVLPSDVRIPAEGALQHAQDLMLHGVGWGAPWLLPLETAYWCLGAPWTPMMYIVPASYKASRLAGDIISQCSLLGFVDTCKFLSQKVFIIRELFHLLNTWVLTPLLGMYVALADLSAAVVRPFAKVWVAIATALGRRESEALVAFSTILKPMVKHTRGVLRAFQLAAGRWLRPFLRTVHALVNVLRKDVQAVRRVLQGLAGKHGRVALRTYKYIRRAIRGSLLTATLFTHKALEYPNIILQAVKARQRRPRPWFRTSWRRRARELFSALRSRVLGVNSTDAQKSGPEQ